MEPNYKVSIRDWQKLLVSYVPEYRVYAPTLIGTTIDYQIIDEKNIDEILYNVAKPASPLKLFFLPPKENVVAASDKKVKTLILGAPSCDLHALDILDEFYLHSRFVDSYYRDRRENTLLIGTDCFETQSHCHCTTYGFNPYPEKNHDIGLAKTNSSIILTPHSEKGRKWVEFMRDRIDVVDAADEIMEGLRQKRITVKDKLSRSNEVIPDHKLTKKLIEESPDDIWYKYAEACVSCGGCATICPTCTCFLLIDRPAFEKVRQMDACQYPGFARVAAGEDPLRQRMDRFRNRYKCKYVYKPNRFESSACTGCGRCIETCIGGIDKNELFIELAEDRKENQS